MINIDLDKIKALVANFEQAFVKPITTETLQTSMQAANTSLSNTIGAKQRPAPYQVPQQHLKNKTNQSNAGPFSSVTNLKQQQQQKQPSLIQQKPLQPFQNPAQTNRNSSNSNYQRASSTGNLNSHNNTPSNSNTNTNNYNNKQFQFKTTPSANISQPIVLNQSLSSQPLIVQSSQKQINERNRKKNLYKTFQRFSLI
jgi:hypothetical protein